MGLFDTSTLYAPLDNTLVLTRGTGNPTFTRATAAWFFNDEGFLQFAPSGAVRFPGKRMVHNQFAKPEDSSAWFIDDLIASNSAPDPFGGTGGITLTGNSAVSNNYAGEFIAITEQLLHVNVSLYIKYVDQQWVVLQFGRDNESSTARVWFDLLNVVKGSNLTTGSGNAVPISYSIDQITDTWCRVQLEATMARAELGSNSLVAIRLVDADGATDEATTVGKQIIVFGWQVEDVRHRSDRTASEYVNRGVLSAPFHGAGVDGVKYFPTAKDGTPYGQKNGVFIEKAATNLVLHNRNATNVAWTKTNITATRNQTGINNHANSASSITASAANGTCLQSLTASGARSFSVYVKRLVGTGDVEITRDNGSTWTDITSSINSSTYTRVAIENTTVTNPVVGFRIVTSGDSVAFDFAQDEAGAVATTPIATTTTSVTRNIDSLTYQTASNFNNTEGAISATITSDAWGAIGNIGSASTGLSTSGSNSGVQALDGTNTVNGPSGTPSGSVDLAIGWAGSNMTAASGGTLGTEGSYDGSFNLSSIALLVQGQTRNLRIWTTELSDTELETVSTGSLGNIFNNDAVKAFGLMNSYGNQYNDILLRWLRQYYSVDNSSLPDLLARYIKENGKDLP